MGKLIILAGGISSRMKKPVSSVLNIDEKLLKETETKAKSMLSVGMNDRPFMDYLLYNAVEAGFRDVLIVLNEKDDSIKSYYGLEDEGNEFLNLKISYAIQKIPEGRVKPLGTADALLQGLQQKRDWAGSKFIVCNSDNLYSVVALRLLLEDEHLNSLIDYSREALEFERSRILKFAVITKNEERYLTDIIEKPNEEELEKAKDKNGVIGVSMNIFSFSYDLIYRYLERTPIHPVRNEKEIPSALTIMIKENPQSMYCYPLSEHVPDLTEKEDIPAVKKYLQEKFK
jgi:glucose-1-phosphate adenylyltransferase